MASFIVRWWQANVPSVRQAYRLHLKKALFRTPIRVAGEKNVYVHSLFVVHNRGWVILKQISNFLVRLQVEMLNRHFSRSRKHIVLVAYPPAFYQTEAIATLRHDILIADLVDDVIARTKERAMKNKYIEECKTILPKCKWIFATSPALEGYRDYAGREVEYLPNGVDPGEYAGDSSGKRHDNRERKTAGYVGNINPLLDMELLEYTIAHSPQVDFVLIGRVDRLTANDLEKLLRLHKNCRYLGERRFTEIPAYLSNFDVLISFKKNDETTRGNESMKIYQYLLSGKPIVSLPLSPADRFTDLMYVASDKFQFVEYLQKALEENDPDIRKKRIETALENSWTKRADVIHARVLNHFGVSTQRGKAAIPKHQIPTKSQ
ncbi:MAG: hypothetical protein A2Z34_09565 [Planctomycetes bacterium RBG_16_59_8]|nr:MAG: hypothetical protein A2Z34_09565 [Planctomycetes bacterium RBG_16_59_8]